MSSNFHCLSVRDLLVEGKGLSKQNCSKGISELSKLVGIKKNLKWNTKLKNYEQVFKIFGPYQNHLDHTVIMLNRVFLKT